MSTRRKPGDRVWLSANSGFVGESDRLAVTILEEDPDHPGQDAPMCMMSCDVMYGKPGGPAPEPKTEAEYIEMCKPLYPKKRGEKWPETCQACHDPDCREWSNVQTDPDPENKNETYCLYHVGECRMFDVKQE